MASTVTTLLTGCMPTTQKCAFLYHFVIVVMLLLVVALVMVMVVAVEIFWTIMGKMM